MGYLALSAFTSVNAESGRAARRSPPARKGKATWTRDAAGASTSTPKDPSTVERPAT
jgi:hypothetical protein